MASKPALILVTGSFSSPDFYNNIIGPLRSRGYEVAAPQLRTVGKKPGPAPSMYDDAALIADEITNFADQGKDVMLIAHSYGGTPASQSVKGLSKAEREKEGKKGGVVRIAYMTCLVPEVGKAAPDGMDPSVMSSITTLDEDGWMTQCDFPASARIVFNHQPADEGAAWAAKFLEHSAPSFGTELTHAGYKDVPTSWLLCEDDDCIPPSLQQTAIERIEKASGKKVDVTRGKYDHCPNLEDPEGVMGWIERAAERGGAWE